jgi:hypothetical protein
MNKKLLIIVIAFLLAFLFTGLSAFSSSLTIESTPIATAKERIFYTYNVEATDDNKGTLTYSLTASPAGMAINANTGVISWTPTKDQIGENEVVVQVSVGNQAISQSFTVTVDKAKLVSIEVLPSEINVEVNRTKAITSVTAYYDNGTNVKIQLNNCSYESGSPDIATVSFDGVITGKLVYLAYEAPHPDENIKLPMVSTITVSYTEESITITDTVLVVVFPKPDCG